MTPNSYTIATNSGKFWPAQSSPATENFQAGIIGSEGDNKNKGSESGYSFLLKTTWIFRCVYWATKKSPGALLHSVSQMKSPNSRNAKKR
jgi:hypothetical protein